MSAVFYLIKCRKQTGRKCVMNNNKTFAAFVLAIIGLGATGCVSEGYSTSYTSGYVATPVVTPTYTEGYTTSYYAPFAVETTIIDVPPPPPPPRHVGHRHHDHHAPSPSVRHRPAGRPPAATRKPAKPQHSTRHVTVPKPAASRPNPPKATPRPRPTTTRPAAPNARPAPSGKGGRPSGGASGRRRR